MNKGLKIFLMIFISMVTAGVAANLLTEVFKTKMKKYYSVD